MDYRNSPSLAFILFKLHYKRIIGGLVLKFWCDVFLAAGPILIYLLIGFVKIEATKNKNWFQKEGTLVSIGLFLTFFFENFLFHQQQEMCNTVGIRMRSALTNLIYRKSLRLSPVSRRTATVGEIVNLMQVNTQVFADLMANIQLVTSIPTQLFFAVALLYYFVGYAAFAALGVVVCILPCLGLVAVFLEKYESGKLGIKDSRLKLISEVLNGIKVWLSGFFY